MINVMGPRPSSLWGTAEQQIGQGFAGLPVDNVGVQYGLEALEAGRITTDQFVDLNDKVGGADIDINHTPGRTAANEPALARSYRSGAVNSTNNLDRVAIIDLRGPDPGAFHDAYRSWAIRARLEREHGTHANQVIWFGAVPLMGDVNYANEGLIAMDRWLATVESDGAPGTLAQKIIRDRPLDVNDRCSQIDDLELVSLPGLGTVCELKEVQTRFGTPRTVAGEGIETDINKCTLKPLRRTDYYPLTFTDAQWQKLQQAFPTGVCDWSRPGVSQADTIPWQTYQSGSGAVVYGGQALGPAPAGSGRGWTSDAFASWRG
jgi:hypothetical protein